MKTKIFQCYIKILSPIHIGCDEVYEPAGFTVNESNRQITVFNFIDFTGSLNDADQCRFNAICSKGTIESILELYKFLRNRSVEGKTIDVCKGLIDHYKKTISMNISNSRKIQNELNSFAISRTAFLQSDQRPYIPGSGVKGALRTAYLNFLEKRKKLADKNKYFKNAQELEKALMDYTDIPGDPFRLVKVSDFMPVGKTATKIVYGVNIKKKQSDNATRGIPTFFEIIQPDTIFQGSIKVETPAKGADISMAVDLDTLLKSASEFYLSEKKRENQDLNTAGVPGVFQNDHDAVLLRCGRHSGAESVTINGHRSIKIMGKKGEKPKYRNRATTLWLASETKTPVHKENLKPFGWSGLYPIDNNLSKKFAETEQAYQDEIKKKNKEKYEAIKRQQQRKQEQAEAEAKKIMEEENQRLAEEERKKQLENMSPEQKLLSEFNEPSITENRIVEIFNKLDELSEEYQQKIAGSLKQYWITNNKWGKKQCSTKQLKKVSKIKQILGDA